MAERISLVEAYDNRDVVAQLIRLRNDVNEILAILENIDPDGDLTNVVTKTGDQTIDGVKTFIGQIIADCDIIQNGAAYETHAEQVFTTKDYINMRDGAIAALAPGDLSGIEIENYDGLSTNCRLAVDESGVARVGDVGDEQPLATRDEVADMTSGALVKWDGVNMKMIAPASNVGSDSKPVKIVNGEEVAVSEDLGIVNEVTKSSYGPVTVNSNSSATIGTATITEAGEYLITAKFSSSGYGSTGGYFCRIDGTTLVTAPFISGLTPVASCSAVVTATGPKSVNFDISQYSSGNLAYSVDVTVVRLK